MPDFIIGGAPRAGTTWLAESLGTHPQIAMAMPLRPEPKVFLRDAPTADAYRERYRDWFGPQHEGMVLGEKTTNYFEDDEAPRRVAEALPQVRMIFVLREPVERAYSNWLWSRMNGLEDLPFADAVASEGERADPLPGSSARPHHYLRRANYARFARRWIEALGRESVAFFLYELLVDEATTDEQLASVQRFVTVEPQPLDRPRALVNEARSTGEPLDRDLRARLRDRVRPLVDDLARVIEVDLSPWGY